MVPLWNDGILGHLPIQIVVKLSNKLGIYPPAATVGLFAASNYKRKASTQSIVQVKIMNEMKSKVGYNWAVSLYVIT